MYSNELSESDLDLVTGGKPVCTKSTTTMEDGTVITVEVCVEKPKPKPEKKAPILE